MNRPMLLDLYCCAGGAAMGYYRAGFDVVGVDIKPQKNFPFLFIQADALDFLARNGRHFAVIHASPPCQAYSEATPLRHRANLPRLIAPTREALQKLGKPYVIENVENARAHLIDPLMLCGTMFGLSVWRHRYFESNVELLPPKPCSHVGRPVTLHSGSNTRKTVGCTGVAAAREAMGIEWMTKVELWEAIPPVFTEHVGKRLVSYLRKEVV